MACNTTPLEHAYGASGSDVQDKLCGPLLDAYGGPGAKTQSLLNQGHELAYTGFPAGWVAVGGFILIIIALSCWALTRDAS